MKTINTDKPINKKTEDRLGRDKFAKQLAETIVDFESKENYVISIQGEWGTGKTSIVNMIVEEIDNLSKISSNKIIILHFEPWNFTDNNQLINQFFVSLAKIIDLSTETENKAKKGTAIEKYAAALSHTEVIPLVGKYISVLPKIASSYGKFMKEQANKSLTDVSFLKKEAEKSLLDLDSRVLVVIDDIDRLSSQQICLIFQLVKSVASFPNMTYLLVYDKAIVARALEDVQGCDGEVYLEKIVQFPIDVPPLNQGKVLDVLFDKLEAIFDNHSNEIFDGEYWKKIFNSCINPFINNIRDVNRFCNVFLFTYRSIKNESNFVDVAGITALKLFAPEIYSWIRDNKQSLVGGNNSYGYLDNNANVNKNEFEELFNNVYPSNPELMMNAVSSLFPAFSNKISWYHDNSTISEIHTAMRIASPKKFDLYFNLSLDQVLISNNEVNRSLTKMGFNEFVEYINYLKSQNLLRDYLDEVKLSISIIPKERVELILNVLLLNNVDNASKDNSLTNVITDRLGTYLIIEILFLVENVEERFSILNRLFEKSDFISFQYLLHILHIIELTHGRVAETNHVNDRKLIELDHLYELERTFLAKIKVFVKEKILLDWEESVRASFLWKFIEEDTYSKYLTSIFTNEINVIKFLSLHVGRWTSGGEVSSYEFSKKSYEDYVSSEIAIEIINTLRFESSFWHLDKKFIEASAAFIINFEGNNRSKQIEIDIINQRVSDWKEEYKDFLRENSR